MGKRTNFEVCMSDENSRLVLEVAVRRTAEDKWERKLIRWDPRTPDPVVTGAVEVRVMKEHWVPWPLSQDHWPIRESTDSCEYAECWLDRRCSIWRPNTYRPFAPTGIPIDADDFEFDLGEPEVGWLPMRWAGGGESLTFEASNVYAPESDIARWLRHLCRGEHPMLQIDIEGVFVEFGTSPWPGGRMRLWGAVHGCPEMGKIDLVANPVSIIRRIHDEFSKLEARFDERDVLSHWCGIHIYHDDHIDDPEIVEDLERLVRRFPDPEVSQFLSKRSAS